MVQKKGTETDPDLLFPWFDLVFAAKYGTRGLQKNSGISAPASHETCGQREKACTRHAVQRACPD